MVRLLGKSVPVSHLPPIPQEIDDKDKLIASMVEGAESLLIENKRLKDALVAIIEDKLSFDMMIRVAKQALEGNHIDE